MVCCTVTTSDIDLFEVLKAQRARSSGGPRSSGQEQRPGPPQGPRRGKAPGAAKEKGRRAGGDCVRAQEKNTDYKQHGNGTKRTRETREMKPEGKDAGIGKEIGE